MKSIIFAVSIGVALVASATVYDDVAIWFDGAKSGTDGRTFATGDAIDVRYVATPSAARNQAEKIGASPKVFTATVKRNLRGDSVSQQVIRIDQAMVESSKTYDPDTGYLVSAKANTFQGVLYKDTMPALASNSTYSVVIRFKAEKSLLANWADERHVSANGLRSALIDIGNETGTNGLLLNLEYSNAEERKNYVVGIRSNRFNCDVSSLGYIEVGKWYELAAVARLGATAEKNYIRLALADEDGNVTFANATQNNESAAAWDPRVDANRRVVLATSRTDGWQKDEVVTAGSSWFRTFNGDIAMYAFWNRSLSDAEISNAFISASWEYPKSFPEVMRIGLDNGSSAEFAGDSATATVSATDPLQWRLAPAEFNAGGQSLSVTFKVSDIASYMAGVNEILRVTPASGSGTLRVSLNSFEKDLELESGKSAYALIPGSAIGTGVQTMTLSRQSGTFSLDAVVLGGSWQVGWWNGTTGSSPGGDMWNASLHTYPVARGDYVTTFGATMYKTGSQLAQNTLVFNMDGELSIRCPYVFSYYNKQVVDNDMRSAVDVYVNESKIFENRPITNNVLHVFKIDPGVFRAGENKLVVSNLVNEASYVSTRYFKLEVQKPKQGAVLLIR